MLKCQIDMVRPGDIRRGGILDLRSLRYFVRIAELGSITLASHELGLVQPALSRHVHRLECELNAQLLVRMPRGVRLTRAGQLYLERCRRILTELEFAKHEVSAEQTAPTQSVTLAIPPSLMSLLAVEFIRRMRESLPRVRLTVNEGLSARSCKQIMDGTLDLAIIADPPVSQAIHLGALASESFVVVGRPSRDAGKRLYTIRSLSTSRFIMPATFRAAIDQQLSRYNTRIQVDLEINSMEGIRQLVLAGMGQTICPVSALRDDVEAGRLQAWRVTDISLQRGLSLAHRLDLSSSGRNAAQVIQAHIIDMAERGCFRPSELN
jgi:LysR family transcriptional regulator, nitrogen assimilation regulatory protein